MKSKILCAIMTTSHDDAISVHEYAVASEYAMEFINIFYDY